jgi:hypothetical protein
MGSMFGSGQIDSNEPRGGNEEARQEWITRTMRETERAERRDSLGRMHSLERKREARGASISPTRDRPQLKEDPI